MSDAGSSGRRPSLRISAVAVGGGDSGSGSRSPRSREVAGLLLALPGSKSPKLRRTGEAATFAAAAPAPAPVREVSHVRYVARGEAVVPAVRVRALRWPLARATLLPASPPPLAHRPRRCRRPRSPPRRAHLRPRPSR
jgi:hypothetical protein